MTDATDHPKATGAPRLPRVLMLTHRLPYPPDRGDRIRSYHLIRTLCEKFELAIACTSDDPVWLQHHQLLSTMARRVAIQPITIWWSKLKACGALLSGRAITPSYYHRDSLAQQILQWHAQAPFDVILTFCSGMHQYARLLTKPARRGQKSAVPRHVIDLVDVDSAKWQAYAAQSHFFARCLYNLEAKRLRRIERGDEDHYDALTVSTPAEAQVYRKYVGNHGNLVVVPNGVDLEYFSPQDDTDSKSIVFIGVLDYRPNVDGIIWFVDQVMPKLRQVVPQVHLQIVGRNPIARVQALDARPGVEVVGSVPDVRFYLRDASLSIAPLRIARGVQNKVLEAMASARTVVCSPGAAAGIDGDGGTHFLVADEPDEWVAHIRSIMTDEPRRRRIATAARRRVESRYNWDECLRPMVKLLMAEPVSESAREEDPARALAS